MQGVIAIEQTLSSVKELLETEGYEVIPIEESDLEGIDAVVVSGMDINLMNVQDTLTDVPVISAAGKTPQDILEELERL